MGATIRFFRLNFTPGNSATQRLWFLGDQVTVLPNGDRTVGADPSGSRLDNSAKRLRTSGLPSGTVGCRPVLSEVPR